MEACKDWNRIVSYRCNMAQTDDSEYRHISYDYFNITTRDIRLNHETIGELPLCDATRLNYFYSTHSFVSTYEDLIDLVYQRRGAKIIAFKAFKDKGFFLRLDELKEKTVNAVMQVMCMKNIVKPFPLLFDEMHNIGKILFTDQCH